MGNQELWDELTRAILSCQRCALGYGKTLGVPGEGNRDAVIMFVGEGPGREEDIQGRPFVGSAGKLLDKMIAAIGLTREEVYIANIVKCRPPGNRVPSEEEAEMCLPYLRQQVYLVKPRMIVCLGSTALRHIIDPEGRITRMRGQWVERRGYWMMPTYHPAALLRDPAKKREAWEDFKKIKAKLEELKEADGR